MDRIRELRKKNNMTQNELASLMGVTQAALSGWETGKFTVDSDTLVKLADYFNCSTDYLLGRVDYPQLEIKKAPPESGAEEVETEMNSPDKLTTEEIKIIRAFLENMKK